MRRDLEQAYNWFTYPHAEETDKVCSTRDVFQARLDHLHRDISQKMAPATEGALLSAVAGEIGNNCFDHNLGQWQDIVGCYFAYGVSRPDAWVAISDRGQGILASLKRVQPNLKTDQEALEVAFQKKISGRSPEKRGNGLKFVRNVMNGNKHRALAFLSGSGTVQFGNLRSEEINWLTSQGKESKGTFALLLWKAL